MDRDDPECVVTFGDGRHLSTSQKRREGTSATVDVRRGSALGECRTFGKPVNLPYGAGT